MNRQTSKLILIYVVIANLFIQIYIFFQPKPADEVAEILGVVNLVGMILYLLYSPERFAVPLIASMIVIGVAAVFKLMHWEGGTKMLALGLGSFVLFYFLRFIKKTDKNWLAYFKVFAIALIAICMLFGLEHWYLFGWYQLDDRLLPISKALILACIVFTIFFK